MLNKRQLALIHIVKNKLNISDKAYRKMISNITRHRTNSSKNMYPNELDIFLKQYGLMSLNQKKELKRLFKRIPINYSDKFLEKRFHIKDFNLMTKAEATKVITVLLKMTTNNTKTTKI